jgi:hypothetical protein
MLDGKSTGSPMWDWSAGAKFEICEADKGGMLMVHDVRSGTSGSTSSINGCVADGRPEDGSEATAEGRADEGGCVDTADGRVSRLSFCPDISVFGKAAILDK